MTSERDENDILGYHLYRVWECTKRKAELSMWYDAGRPNSTFSSYVLVIHLDFIDTELERKQKLKSYE
jgi:hypothetical protein